MIEPGHRVVHVWNDPQRGWVGTVFRYVLSACEEPLRHQVIVRWDVDQTFEEWPVSSLDRLLEQGR